VILALVEEESVALRPPPALEALAPPGDTNPEAFVPLGEEGVTTD
jgi:hypothetical protein